MEKIGKNIFRLLLAIVLLSATACTSLEKNSLISGPVFARNFPPAGPENYQSGMVDGCKTASGAAGSALLSLIYNKVYYDVDRALSDRVYYTAWKDGFNYCKYELDSTLSS